MLLILPPSKEKARKCYVELITILKVNQGLSCLIMLTNIIIFIVKTYVTVTCVVGDLILNLNALQETNTNKKGFFFLRGFVLSVDKCK